MHDVWHGYFERGLAAAECVLRGVGTPAGRAPPLMADLATSRMTCDTLHISTSPSLYRRVEPQSFGFGYRNRIATWIDPSHRNVCNNKSKVMLQLLHMEVGASIWPHTQLQLQPSFL